MKITLTVEKGVWILQSIATGGDGETISALATKCVKPSDEKMMLALMLSLRDYFQEVYPGSCYPIPDNEVDPDIMRAWHNLKGSINS